MVLAGIGHRKHTCGQVVRLGWVYVMRTFRTSLQWDFLRKDFFMAPHSGCFYTKKTIRQTRLHKSWKTKRTCFLSQMPNIARKSSKSAVMASLANHLGSKMTRTLVWSDMKPEISASFDRSRHTRDHKLTWERLSQTVSKKLQPALWQKQSSPSQA